MQERALPPCPLVTDTPDGAAAWITTLEAALTMARQRNAQARALFVVLLQHVSDDHLRERMREWLGK
jgi:hypothetical protein